MVRTFIQAFTSPAAGPAGFGLALVLCALLGVTAAKGSRTEAALRGQVATLMADSQRNGLMLHARLAACEGRPAELERMRSTNASLTAEQRAQRLRGGPTGFDVCARMESADRAVLETLR